MTYDPYSDSMNPSQRALYAARPLTAPSYRPTAVGQTVPTNNPAANALSNTISTPNLQTDNYANPAPAPTADPGWSTADLAKWGYTGNVPINNVEQEAINFANNLYSTQGPLNTLAPAQQYLQDVLAGKYGPQGMAYVQGVINPMKESAMTNYADLSKNLARHFSEIGGYYGGQSGIAQGKLAAQTSNDLNLQIAQLLSGQYNQDQANRGTAAGQLTSLGQVQSGLSGDMLNYLLGAGNLITQRDLTNRAGYQDALNKSYQDWVRARQELLGMYGDNSLLGTQATQNVVTTSTSPFAALLQGLGGAAGMVGGNVGTSDLMKALKLG